MVRFLAKVMYRRYLYSVDFFKSDVELYWEAG